MERGVIGPHGLFVTRAVMVEKEKDIASVTIHFLYMEGLTALNNDTRQRIAILRVVQVNLNLLLKLSVTFFFLFFDLTSPLIDELKKRSNYSVRLENILKTCVAIF